MNRKIMDNLSYGFYFIIICLIILSVYLIFFRQDKKQSENNIETKTTTERSLENIKLNQDNVYLDIGGSFELKVTLISGNGSEKIKYESENSNIATVDEFGLITGVSAGTTKILVTVLDTNIKTECVVNVTGNIITISGLFVSEETVNMSINDTYNIGVTIVPNNAVDKRLVYASSNESIVTVDQNGLVRAINKGYSKVVISSYNDPNIKVEISFYVK